MNLGLEGKVAIVTGSGRGIGAGIARVLAQEGAIVMVNDIRGELAEDMAAQLREEGLRAAAAQGDVSDSIEVAEMVARIKDQHGPVHVLVNNVGALPFVDGKPQTRPVFHKSTREYWDAEINTVMYSTFTCTYAVINDMIEQRKGKIVNIASTAGYAGMATMSLYSAAKAGVMGFTRSLATEVGRYGINVNAVAPGPILAGRGLAREEAAKRGDPDATAGVEYSQRVLGLTTLGRYGQPEDIGRAVAFLASDAANFINGHTLPVDGGFPVLRYHFADPEFRP